MSKYNLEYVREIFSYNGCELIEGKYVNFHTPMQYRCSCGNISKINLNNFKQGKRCKKCATRKNNSRYEINIEDVKEEFLDSGCELLEPLPAEPIYLKTKVKYRCLCGEESEISIKFKLEYVRDIFFEAGCELLAEEYHGASVPMEYRCSCGNISKITLNSFNNGSRCYHCLIQKRSGENNYQWIKDRKYYEKCYKFRQRCYKILKALLKKSNQKKAASTKSYLGYDWIKLMNHIENHPNWKDLDENDWHIDHIFPIKAFIDYKIFDSKIVNSLDNIQPLSSQDNMKKNAKYDKEKFENYLKSKGIILNEQI